MKALIASSLILGLFVALVATGFMVYGSGLISPRKEGKVLLKGEGFSVEIADNPMKRSMGLSGKESLGGNEGMLFLFSRPSYQSFWMKGMVIPIDIIWIKGNKVVGFNKDVQPEPGVRTTNLKIYSPPEAADKVLEVEAGTVDRLGVQVSDEVIISL